MVRVTVTRDNLLIGSRICMRGDVAEVPDDRAMQLVNRGAAVFAGDAEPPRPAPGRAPTRRPTS
jgi:hypothetical protein